VPMVPIRDVVVFPHMMIPFVIGRALSVRALEQALATDKRIFLATQIDATVDDPAPSDIYSVGTVANIVQSLKLHDGNIKVLVEGRDRARIVKIDKSMGYLSATVAVKSAAPGPQPRTSILVKRLNNLLDQLSKLNPGPTYDALFNAAKSLEPDQP